MQNLFVAWFGALVLVLIAIKGVLDLASSIEYAQDIFPWLKKFTQSKRGWHLLLSLTCLFYGGTLYELLKEPPPVPIVFANPGTSSIEAVVQENRSLRAQLEPFEIKESPDSLRRRTIKLVDDLLMFWNTRPTVPMQPVPNPASEEDRKRNENFDRYWREAEAAYQTKDFKNRILEIVRAYKNLGIGTGFLEQEAEQPNRLIGGAPFGGVSLDNCYQQCASELCLLRELAFHVDAHDKAIKPEF